MYRVVEVPAGASDLPEALGTKPKFWYFDDVGQLLLYKEGRPGSGEHWSEKICAEIAELLKIPHASYELARWKGRNGVVSPTFVPTGGRLILGNELLARLVDAKYATTAKRFAAKQHSVRAVMGVLGARWVLPPYGFDMPTDLVLARSIFVGYLLLDALVGNQDRHHENWGLILTQLRGPQESLITLAPTYDHASSLGRNEGDAERQKRLHTRDRGFSVEHYVQRAESAFFLNPSSDKPLSTLAAFEEAAKIEPRAAAYWRNRLRDVPIERYKDLIDLVPPEEMSQPARDFAFRMIELNRSRLLHNG
jgi:hypothetical protein